jgi:hypothetical protein
VREELHDIPFYTCAKQQDHVETLQLRIERPNPRYRGSNRITQIVEGTNARLVALVLKADPGSDLNIDDALVREAIEHAEDDNGSYEGKSSR